MANALYDLAREAFVSADLDWLADDIKCILVDDADYTKNLVTDQFLEDVPGAARVATSANLGSKTAALGVCDAADTAFATVTGDPCEEIVIYEDDAGGEGASRLILNIDTASGLPVTPNGSDIDLVWDSGGNKVFRF